MKKILIINKEQYGQHIDSYKYCKYLGNKYNLKYLCFDQGYNKIKDEVDVVYVKKHNNSLVSTLIFVQEINKELKKEQYDLIFVVYFSFCSLLRLTNFSTHFLLDIRSSLIYQNYIKRRLANLFLLFETFFYKDITLISDSLRRFLYISKKKTHIIPLGADILSAKNKNYSNMHLFYIGTLSFRNIHDTIYGLKEFIEQVNVGSMRITYDIFGDGSKKFLDLLYSSIEKTELSNVVNYHGRKSHEEVQDYIDKCNIGISYIPITDFFDCQPPTKTFEYIFSGMVCIATSTSENKKLINSANGILCQDNSTSFKDALIKVFNNKGSYNSTDIIKTLGQYQWKRIIDNQLSPLIDNIIKETIK